jgi:hypothetical protein
LSAFSKLMLAVFTLTLFCSATLLFLVQPMVGKMVTPLLGGTPAVWNTCMVFFQAALLAGYAYAHGAPVWLGGVRRQAGFHLVLLLAPLALFVFFPLTVNKNLVRSWEYPVLTLLVVLVVSVGVPFFVVSATAPLLQRWFAGTDHPSARDPYFLYAASNVGSMLALLGYPVVVEPNLVLGSQRLDWMIGFGVLVVLIGACAVFLWKSAPTAAGSEKSAPPKEITTTLQDDRAGKRGDEDRYSSEARLQPVPNIVTPNEPPMSRTRPVTAARRLRWVLLAAIPSSLMLGVTTYITTDVAPIPLLWILPLALYLLSFIIVFSKLSAVVQSVLVWLTAMIGQAAVMYIAWPYLENNKLLVVMIWLLCLSGMGASTLILFIRNDRLIYNIMIGAMVVTIPFLLVFMLSESMVTETTGMRLGNLPFAISLHLFALFVVAMVCHGELARDRPAAKNLTEFFLLMSLGGVLGGLFNALFAPMIFNDIIEYQLAMVAACLMVPARRAAKVHAWALYVDLALLTFCVVIGTTLIVVRVFDGSLKIGLPARIPLFSFERWQYWLFRLVGIALLALAFLYVWGRERRLERVLDLALPLALGILAVGLVWALHPPALWDDFEDLAKDWEMDPNKLAALLAYGLPAFFCYTFVDRPLRFGLGVGAILAAGALCGYINDKIIYQTRSFFGVLMVEDDGTFCRLVHGTTLHGKQYIETDKRSIPLTYFSRTGPIGQVMEAYNQDGKRNIAIIGLGTGTLAAYAKEGQNMTFYEIDKAVRDIAFDTDKYFTYIKDARDRGAKMDFVLGDARLTMERKNLSPNEKYGILVVDAFSSDAIPIHLLTREALKVYLDKTTEDGILAFHISNRYLDLRPVLANLAEEEGLVAFFNRDPGIGEIGKAPSTWVVLARKKEHLEKLLAHKPGEDPLWNPVETNPRVGVWTDDYSNLLSVFSW